MPKTTYPKARSFRPDDESLAIIERIRSTGAPGREINFTDAIVIALHTWADHDSRTPEEVLEALRALQQRTDKVIWDV